MSSSNPSAVLVPSGKTALGLFAVTVGYLAALVGVVFYTWQGMHSLYGVPVLLVPAIGFFLIVAGGAMVWIERA